LKHSISIITPLSWLEKADALFASLGWGAHNFLVPLSPDGTDPATHLGLRATADAMFVRDMETALASLPELHAAIAIDLRDDSDRASQFETLMTRCGLSRVEPVVDI